MKKLSIIIPVYNEEKTISEIIRRVKNARLKGIEKEIVIVDDASTDGTKEILNGIKDNSIKIIYHKKNMGKGFAIRTALNYATGNIILIQDADLEYNPEEYPKLLEPIIEGKATVVYGSRQLGKKHSKYARLAYYIAGLSLTALSNILYGINITDEPCGYKVFSSDVIKGINLKCKRFEFCPEITAKISKKGIKIYEVPSSYSPRSRKEGKKIKFSDWLEAVYTLVKYRFVD
ncbi:MAG: glycosyltransferase family 2 protein [Nanoarchaeota archaeon]|nr:glycosyltransferase family 2 protein [Nanoarchaeota archaeon]